jgi:gas vesicle protein
MVNNFDVINFHRNLDLLRSITGLDKGGFSELLGVWNLYRKDINSLGPKTLKAIEDHFDGVDEGWLNTYHDTLSDGILFTPRKNMSFRETPAAYGQDAPEQKEDMDQYQAKAIMLTSKVMTSRHKEIGKALMKNLEEFAEAVSTKDELARCKIKIEEQDRKIEDQDKKIGEMDIEIKNLKTQVAELLRREQHCNSVTPGDGVPVPEDQAM